MRTLVENLQLIKDTKLEIKNAIIAKGGTITDSTSFSDYPNQIRLLPTSSGSGIDWSLLGYTEAPEVFTGAFSVAKTIYDNWDASVSTLNNAYESNKELVYFPLVDTSNVTSMTGTFKSCHRLELVPLLDTSNVTNMAEAFKECEALATISLIDTSNVTSMNSMFAECSSLKALPLLDTSKVTTMNQMFTHCNNLTTIPKFDTANVTDMYRMFYGSSGIETIPELDTSKVTNMQGIFYNCSNLHKVEGLDFSSIGNFGNSASTSSNPIFYFGTSGNTSIKYMVIKNLGKNSACKTANFGGLKKWGYDITTPSTPNADNIQSLKDTLLTYSFDRAAAGYDTCNVTLSSDMKAIYNSAYFTDEERSQIAAKGFTIA